MTNRKKEYKEPSLDVIKLRMPKILSDQSEPADQPGNQARRYDFDE